jgi:acyl carrier protein
MNTITDEIRQDIRRRVIQYFADECGKEVVDISEQTDIIRDLDGDSLMLLSLLEIFRKKYGLTIELKTLGKHLMKKPADTVGQVIDLSTKIVQYGDELIHVDL